MQADPRPLRIVRTDDELETECAALRRAEVLAVDTEFIRESTYYPRLCLVQLADAERLVVVDALGPTTLAPLVALLADTSILKVLHAARQDLEIFAQMAGAVPAPVFDTQLAASLLGFGEQVGYAALVQRLLGVALDKAHTRTDWAARPLPAGAIEYAADDVRYLLEVHRLMREQLAARDRLEWLDAEHAQLARLDTYRVDPDEAWRKLRGMQRLTGAQRARARALAAWRERTAIALDRPRGWVLKDDALLEVARRNPADEAGLAAIRDLPPQTVKRRGAELLEALRTAGPAPEAMAERPRLTGDQEVLVDLLQALTRKRAADHAVAPANLATRRDLERLVLGERDLEVLVGRKRDALGAALLEVLEGRLALRVVRGVLVEERPADGGR